MISILILTLNEEQNISACLGSVAWSDDVVVLDSFSRDRTMSIAKRAGARVFQRSFDDFAGQQNWALKNIKFKHSWVFYLDADERMTGPLRAELMAIASGDDRKVAYFCPRRNFFMGRWIKHCFPPVPVLRFFRPSKTRFKRVGHAPEPIIRGDHGYLRESFDHYNFSKGFGDWFDKHNRYSHWEALEGLKTSGLGGPSASLWSNDSAERRKALKALFVKMPLRPFLKFAYLYLFKRGFLDGYPGFLYCVLQSFYELQIVLKIKEMEYKEKGLTL